MEVAKTGTRRRCDTRAPRTGTPRVRAFGSVGGVRGTPRAWRLTHGDAGRGCRATRSAEQGASNPDPAGAARARTKDGMVELRHEDVHVELRGSPLVAGHGRGQTGGGRRGRAGSVTPASPSMERARVVGPRRRGGSTCDGWSRRSSWVSSLETTSVERRLAGVRWRGCDGVGEGGSRCRCAAGVAAPCPRPPSSRAPRRGGRPEVDEYVVAVELAVLDVHVIGVKTAVSFTLTGISCSPGTWHGHRWRCRPQAPMQMTRSQLRTSSWRRPSA